MKHGYKIYLEPKDLVKLKQKANNCGFNGRGCVSYYLTKIATEQIIFVDKEVIALLNRRTGK